MYHRLEYPLFSHPVNEHGQEKNYTSNDGISSNQATNKRSQCVYEHEGKIEKSHHAQMIMMSIRIKVDSRIVSFSTKSSLTY